MVLNRREHAASTGNPRHVVQVTGSAPLVVHRVSSALSTLFRRDVVLGGSTSLVTDPLPQGSEPLAGGTGLGMLRPKRLLADGKRGGRVRALPGGVPTAPDI